MRCVKEFVVDSIDNQVLKNQLKEIQEIWNTLIIGNYILVNDVAYFRDIVFKSDIQDFEYDVVIKDKDNFKDVVELKCLKNIDKNIKKEKKQQKKLEKAKNRTDDFYYHERKKKPKYFNKNGNVKLEYIKLFMIDKKEYEKYSKRDYTQLSKPKLFKDFEKMNAKFDAKIKDKKEFIDSLSEEELSYCGLQSRSILKRYNDKRFMMYDKILLKAIIKEFNKADENNKLILYNYYEQEYNRIHSKYYSNDDEYELKRKKDKETKAVATGLVANESDICLSKPVPNKSIMDMMKDFDTEELEI